MNQQAIDRVKERLSKYLKRTDDSDKSYDNWYCKALEHTIEDLQSLWDGWIPVTERLPEYWEIYLVFAEWVRNVCCFNFDWKWSNAWIEFPLKVTHYQPLQLPPITK